MDLVIQKILKVLGWQKLLAMAWKAALPIAMERAKKTETKFDDSVVELLDEVIHLIVADEHAK